MARRRRRGPDIIGLAGALVGLMFLLVFAASGGNLHRFNDMMSALFGLACVGLVVIIIGVVGFFVIRSLNMTLTGLAAQFVAS